MKTHLKPVMLTWFALAFCLAASGCDSDVTEARFMASWSPDSARVAYVSSLPDGKSAEPSRISIFDATTQETRRLAEFPAGLACVHPQWSPYGDEILFGVIDLRKESSHDEDGLINYSVWTIRADGKDLRMVAESTARESTILQPNAVNWTDVSGEVLFQRVIGGRLHARLMDLNDGSESDYLPEAADGYLLVPSPDRSLIAALLFNYSASTAKLCLRNRISREWQLTDTINYDRDRLNGLAQMMVWSPDSSRLLVAGAEKRANPAKPARHLLRLYDITTGNSRAMRMEVSGDSICWNADSSAFYVALRGQSARAAGIYRVDASASKLTPVLSDSRSHLLGMNSLDGRLYFLRSFEEESDSEVRRAKTAKYSQFFSCALDGSDIQEIGRIDSTGLSLSSSPDGNSLLLFADDHPIASLNTRLGQLRDVELQDESFHPVRR